MVEESQDRGVNQFSDTQKNKENNLLGGSIYGSEQYILPHQLDLLNFYRSEIKHEFNLLVSRLNLLIICQSFLVVPFVILNNSTQFQLVLAPNLLVIFLGAYTSFVIIKPLSLTQAIIREWLGKQKSLLKHVKNNAYKSSRDINLHDYSEHEQSLAFSKKAPTIFLIFWICGFIWTVIRVIYEMV